jgi:hypothetical protein
VVLSLVAFGSRVMVECGEFMVHGSWFIVHAKRFTFQRVVGFPVGSYLQIVKESKNFE